MNDRLVNLAYARTWWTVALGHDSASHERRRPQDGSDNTEQSVGVRPIHVEEPVTPINRDLVAVVFFDAKMSF